jgi:PAS domain S-box-containing protein
MFKHLSLGKNSVILFFVLGIFVLVSTTIVTYLNSMEQLDRHDYITDGYKRIDMVEKIQSLISEAEASKRGYQISSDPEYFAAINNTKTSADSILRTLKSQYREYPKTQLRLDTLVVLVNERFELIDRSIFIIDKKGASQKLLQPLTEQGKSVTGNIRSVVSRLRTDEINSISAKHELGDQSYRFTFYTIAGGVTVSCIIFVFVFIALRKFTGKGNVEDEEITKEELESIVRERTAEISQINNKLNINLEELRKKEEELKISEQYYKMLFEQAHDAIIILDPSDERVIDVNNRACQIYGFSRKEFIGLSLKKISKNVIQGDENMKKTLEKGYYHNFQTVHYNKNLNEMLIEINASVISYGGKKAILSIHRDITDRVLMIH